MEEADLLKERLQAITDKRRIQEEISRKRRQIEEEKLKLQYIKKKALRDQWLMDGLNQQSEEELEATRLQAQDEQQQSDMLQSNIHRMELEIQALEKQELDILTNEEVVLKRLKEVERSAEDIIKELQDEYLSDQGVHGPSVSGCGIPGPDVLLFTGAERVGPIHEPDETEPTGALVAMKINVEHDHITGERVVVSTAAVTGSFWPEGQKVYEDGFRSVYALPPEGASVAQASLGEMSLAELEELLRQAYLTVPTGVQYHLPVFSAPYTGSNAPAVPGTKRAMGKTSSLTEADNHIEANQNGDIKETFQTPRLSLWHPDYNSIVQRGCGKDISPQEYTTNSLYSVTTPLGLDCSSNQAGLMPITARSKEMPGPKPKPLGFGGLSPSIVIGKSKVEHEVLTEVSSRLSQFCVESVSPLNLVHTLPDQLESDPVTMVFLGYENAVDHDHDVHAELVMIGNSSDEEQDAVKHEHEAEQDLSYHPQGYKSKVFHPRVGRAKVGCGNMVWDDGSCPKDLTAHTPTFTYKPGKRFSERPGQSPTQAAYTDSITLEEVKLAPNGRDNQVRVHKQFQLD